MYLQTGGNILINVQSTVYGCVGPCFIMCLLHVCCRKGGSICVLSDYLILIVSTSRFLLCVRVSAGKAWYQPSLCRCERAVFDPAGRLHRAGGEAKDHRQHFYSRVPGDRVSARLAERGPLRVIRPTPFEPEKPQSDLSSSILPPNIAHFY